MSENNIYIPEHLELVIYSWRGALGIGKDAIKLLNMPQFVSLRVNPKLRSIAIIPCGRHDPMSFEVPARLFVDHRCTFRIYSKDFKNWIRTIGGIDDKKTYIVDGRYSEKSNLVYFPIGEGKIRELYEKPAGYSDRMSS
ncbi:MAG: hypothetical protein IJ740_17400 [Ruminococcus sp.]|nr:hypothetical protein [Ruminococcus sp.]